MSFPGGSLVNNLPANAGDTVLIPGLGKSPGEVNDNPLQFSRLEKSLQRSMADYSPWGHKSVRQNLVTIQQHSFYMKCKEK